MTPLITPVPNLNGNSADDLVRKLKAVLEALALVQERMMEASDVTHGRNFQHLIRLGDWSEHHRVVGQAQNAWGERRQMLNQFVIEITEMAAAIQEQSK